jgi:hypothetical protein
MRLLREMRAAAGARAGAAWPMVPWRSRTQYPFASAPRPGAMHECVGTLRRACVRYRDAPRNWPRKRRFAVDGPFGGPMHGAAHGYGLSLEGQLPDAEDCDKLAS